MNLLSIIEDIFIKKNSIVIITQAINTIIFWIDKLIKTSKNMIDNPPQKNKKIVQSKDS